MNKIFSVLQIYNGAYGTLSSMRIHFIQINYQVMFLFDKMRLNFFSLICLCHYTFMNNNNSNNGTQIYLIEL
jgi:hypothetical protein